MDITLPELEDAINYWRSRRPSRGEERSLSPEVDALASVYALMIFNRMTTIPIEQIGDIPRRLLEARRNQES